MCLRCYIYYVFNTLIQKTSRSRCTSGDDDDGEAEDGIVKVVAVAQERWAFYRRKPLV